MEGKPSNEKRSWTVICPGLFGLSGHEHPDIKALLDQVDHEVYDVAAWGRKDAVAIVRSEPWFKPVFSKILYDRLADPFLTKMRNLVRRERIWYHELLFALRQVQWKRNDIVFVHTFSVYSIWQWWRLRHWFEQRKIHLFLLFHYSPFMVPAYLRPFYGWFYSKLASGLPYIHLLTVSEELRDEYLRYSPQPMRVVPIPINLSAAAQSGATPQEDGQIIIAYPGSARTDKGFQLLPRALSRFLQNGRSEDVRFRIQCSLPGTGVYEAACEKALNDLKGLCKKWKNLELIEFSLAPAEYERFLNNANVILLPYIGQEYKTHNSGILTQSLAIGKLCVVPKKTTLARQIDELGWGETFEADNDLDLSDKIAKAVDRWRNGDRLASETIETWRALHDPQILVKAILEQAK